MKLLEGASPRGRSVRIGALVGAALALIWVLLILIMQIANGHLWVGSLIVIPLQLVTLVLVLSGIGSLIGLAVAAIRGLPGKPPPASLIKSAPTPPPPPSPNVEPGWYPAPDSPVLQRYWDGTNWTPNSAPRAPSVDAGDPDGPEGGK